MNLRDLWSSLLRRWYVLLPAILFSCALGVLALGAVPPRYEASADVVLIPPTDSGDNPFLYLGGLDQAVMVVVRAVGSEDVRNAVAEKFPTADYSVVRDPASSGPILLIDVSDVSPSGTLDVLDLVLAEVSSSLVGLQEVVDVPAGSRISTMTIARDDETTSSQRARYEAAVLVVGGGIVLSVLATALIDRILSRRRAS